MKKLDEKCRHFADIVDMRDMSKQEKFALQKTLQNL